MNCCIECFKDTHIRSTIEKHGIKGNCDFCSSKNIFVYDITVDTYQISDKLIGLVQMYAVSDDVNAKFLKKVLYDDWDIFNVESEIIQTLIKKVYMLAYQDNFDIFTKKVSIPQLSDPEFLHTFGVVRDSSWSEFSNSIKYKNRFHSGMFNADVFASFLSFVVKVYSPGSNFFRARISSDNIGFTKENMGAPPIERRCEGRINPSGISVLYLSSDYETILNEVRATIFDYVTIGEFKPKRDIKVVNLSGISEISPFLYQGELEKYAANRKVFQEIAKELAKPLRRSDSPLEYLPTQYIAEFIKSQGYDGVEYASTLKKGGYNLAIFDENLFECIGTKAVEINSVNYDFSRL